MTDIELVIKIPEEKYQEVVNGHWRNGLLGILCTGVANGTLLPKGHGALKDSEKLYADVREKEELARQRVIDTPSNSPCYMRYVAQLNERTAFKEMIYDAETIIEADRKEQE